MLEARVFAAAAFNSVCHAFPVGFPVGSPPSWAQPPLYKIPGTSVGDVIHHLYNQERPVIGVVPVVDDGGGHTCSSSADTPFPPTRVGR